MREATSASKRAHAAAGGAQDAHGPRRLAVGAALVVAAFVAAAALSHRDGPGSQTREPASGGDSSAHAPRPWPAPSRRQNVVMAMAYNYPLFRFRIFVRSLRESGFKGDVILFTNLTADTARDKRRGGAADDPAIPELLKEHGVEWHDAADLGADVAAMHPKLRRYHLYAEHASRPEFQNSLILVVDFRDVLFQADPFEGVTLQGEWLRFYEELFPPTMKQSNYTYEWIRECWGDDAAERVADAIVVCSGATMGTAAGIAHYARTMAHAVQTAPRPVCADHDQRYHNYLLYNGQFKRVRTLRAGHAEVYNLGYIGKHDRAKEGAKPSRFRHIDDITVLRPDGSLWAVVNEDGRIAPVLHQYDRMKWLWTAVVARYAE